MKNDLVLSVSDFVGILNQTLEYAYPNVTIVGELANFRVSKNRWVYFDLKDDLATVKFFGTVYNLPGPLEDGLTLQVKGMPRLHPNFGFSVTVQSILPIGEGSLKKAALLLETKLRAEGLFAAERKRLLPHPPKRIALITSSESAAYSDFIKILAERWGGVEIDLYNVLVQGEAAVGQIVEAIASCNAHSETADVLVITRGGGSAEDLAVFNTEQVTRAIAGSRIPTLVAIGHEVDISMAELAADQRASTPSNAAQLLTPDRAQEISKLKSSEGLLKQLLRSLVEDKKQALDSFKVQIETMVKHRLLSESNDLKSKADLLNALSPQAALKRGYAILRGDNGVVLHDAKAANIGQTITAQLNSAVLTAKITDIQLQ